MHAHSSFPPSRKASAGPPKFLDGSLPTKADARSPRSCISGCGAPPPRLVPSPTSGCGTADGSSRWCRAFLSTLLRLLDTFRRHRIAAVRIAPLLFDDVLDPPSEFLTRQFRLTLEGLGVRNRYLPVYL